MRDLITKIVQGSIMNICFVHQKAKWKRTETKRAKIKKSGIWQTVDKGVPRGMVKDVGPHFRLSESKTVENRRTNDDSVTLTFGDEVGSHKDCL